MVVLRENFDFGPEGFGCIKFREMWNVGKQIKKQKWHRQQQKIPITLIRIR